MSHKRSVPISNFYFLFVLFFSLLFVQASRAQVISGILTNEIRVPIPYATIYVQETREGTITNAQGRFNIQVEPGTYNLTIRSLGFVQLEEEVRVTTDSVQLQLVMKRQRFEIKEVKVFPGKEDPAYFIMRKAIANASFYRKKIKHYEADLYIKSNFSFSNIPKIFKNREVEDGKKLKDFFKENTTYVIESHNTITFDYPNTYDQKVISKKSSLTGFDEPPVMGLMTESFYQERPNQVISPLSSLALKHYKYQYEGFITVGDFDVFKIKVIPKRTSDELVEGYIYIVDKLWCIYNLDFSSNFEFFHYRIKQQFENLGNKNWLPVTHNITGYFGMLGLRGNFYYGASVKYDSIVDNSFVQSEMPELAQDTIEVKQPGAKELTFKSDLKQITDKEELTNRDVKKAARLNRKILKEQYKDSTIVAGSYYDYTIEDEKDSLRTDIAWDTIRTIPLTPDEIRSYEMADSLVAMETSEPDSAKAKNKTKSVLMKVLMGHYDLCKDSLVRLSYDGILNPENSDFNAVDGYKFRQRFQLRLNPDSGRYIYITPILGYAFHRKSIYGSLNTRFRDILARGNQLELEGGLESRDFKPHPLGITPAINSISSWFFAENYMRLYETGFMRLNLSQRLKKEFTISAAVEYNQFNRMENTATYRLSDNKEYAPNIPFGFEEDSPELQKQKSLHYTAAINYRKRLRKPWLEESPFLFMSDFVSAGLKYKQGVKNLFSSVSDFSQIDFNLHYQANISPSAGIDLKLNTGYFFQSDQMHFSQFKHFASSEIIVPFKQFSHRFQLLNDYQLSTNESYLNVGTEFRSEYLLIRYLSFLNKRTWSESLHLNYLTTPGLNNYWEAGYSLNSLFFIGNIGVFTGFKGGDFESVMVKFAIFGFD